MKVIIGKTFRNERIDLENTAFQKCSFINCEIYADKGNFNLINCDFSNCKLSLGKSATAITKLLTMFYPDMPLWIEGEETKEQVLLRMKNKLQQEGLI